VSFFLYIYAVKIQNTILLFFIFTFSLLANNTVKTDHIKENISPTIVNNQDANTGALVAPAIANKSDGGVAPTNKGNLNSILGYSIFIFFSVLIIILVDNIKLQRKYKELASDLKSKEPIL